MFEGRGLCVDPERSIGLQLTEGSITLCQMKCFVLGFATTTTSVCSALVAFRFEVVLVALALMVSFFMVGCREPAPLSVAKELQSASKHREASAPIVSSDSRPLPLAKEATELVAARKRIDVLTQKAADVVVQIEAKAPNRVTLVRLDQVFIEARRLLLTDVHLARLGDALSDADRTKLTRYSRDRYEGLKRRVAKAGVRHRAAKQPQAVTQSDAP
ncbi:MAG: hypothetical protein CMH53_02920 [Myxococcales bacterium]|nr:hypothetical protein [Myxococcales bacterium]